MDKLTRIRRQFPFIKNNPDLIYLDSAATTLKPYCVLESIANFYTCHNANIHRSTHSVAEKATLEFELARQKIANFVNADTNEIIFTYNASYAFNLLVQMLPISSEDIILGSPIEHHSNFLPWRKQGKYYALPLDEKDNILVEDIPLNIIRKAKYMAINYVSNVTGKIQQVDHLLSWARSQGIITIVDGSQAMCHLPINVKSIGADYFIFSGHKMLGPSGVGVLYGRYDLLDQLKPRFLGGGMVHKIDSARQILKPVPHCFEVGTPNIENVIGLGIATDFLRNLDQAWIRKHLNHLSEKLKKGLELFPQIQLVNPNRDTRQVPIFSFKPLSYHDVQMLARLLSDQFGILTTAGQQCAHPYYSYRRLVGGSIRISINFYNSESEVEALLKAVEHLTLLLPGESNRTKRRIA